MALTNTLTTLIQTIAARGVISLRNQVWMTRLVNLDYKAEAREKGDTIDIPIPVARATSAVTPAAVPSDPENTTTVKKQIELDQWQKSNFGLKDDEMNKIMASDFYIPSAMQESFKALAGDINASVFQQYKGVYGYVGTAGTTPFGSGVTTLSSINCRKILNQQLAPRDFRSLVMDVDAEAAALSLPAFSDAEKTGSGNEKLSGEIGQKFGFGNYWDIDVPTHTAGDLGGTGVDTVIKSATAHAIGVTTLTITVGATNDLSLLEGDIITIAGDDQTYVVTTATGTVSATADGSVIIQPPLKVALTGSEVITLKASHVVNLAFHRDAFALAIRQPGQGLDELGKEKRTTATVQDPLSGLIMRVEVIDQYKQRTWEVDALWGVKLVRPELVVRLAG
jgi:hypothetical protein